MNTSNPENERKMPQSPSNSESANANALHSQAGDQRTQQHKKLKRTIVLLLATVLVVVVLAVGIPVYVHISTHESTDDAHIDGQIVPISSRVAGHVAQVLVTDNQPVTSGELLLELDPGDFQVRMNTAQAMVQNAEALVDAARSGKAEVNSQLAFAKATLAQARSELAAVEAKYQQSAADLKRYRELAASNTISPQQLDHAATSERMAAAELEAARSKVTTQQTMVQKAEAAIMAAEDNIRQAQAQVAARQSQLKQAALDLSYTKIHAATDGFVTKKNVEAGAFIQVGQSLMAIVSPEVWVTANFKETQLTHMRPGQSVEISVDTFPGVTFHGCVESIQRGTGSRFSLLPAENATGNFVKVVQRIPVKIVFNRPEQLSDYLLVPGMSVVPQVDITAQPSASNIAGRRTPSSNGQ